MYSTRCAQETATDAAQIFGGRGISAGGMGAKIEHVSGHLDHIRGISLNYVFVSITEQLLSMLFLEEARMCLVIWVSTSFDLI